MKMLLFVVIATLAFMESQAKPLNIKEPSTCGYASCHPVKEDLINIHLVPHTHDDVGWLKTVDQYFYGSKTSTQKAGVQYILDSVMDALAKNPDRRFIYVETAFFWKWWTQQDDDTKAQVKKLIENGQLELTGGAWSMNDEAAAHYHSIIDQFAWGLRKLNDTFGSCGRPKMGWQIDPFGHSREMASIFSQLGFDGLMVVRIDYLDKAERLNTETAEMVWRGSDNLGSSSDLFTNVHYSHYSAPGGFCFDVNCGDDPIIDDPKSTEYNVDQRINDFFAHLDGVTPYYLTNNILVTLGDDFMYQYASQTFKNLDKLIKYANQRQADGSKYNLLYSTPSCYVKAIYDETIKNNLSWDIKRDDFFPYGSDPHAYWTGYFTSRPTSKGFERLGNNFLQICKQLYILSNLESSYEDKLDSLREAMGVFQHHDAITGTEKQHVADDYAFQLHRGISNCENVTSEALSKIISNGDEETPSFETCLLSNISSCDVTENSERFVVTVYNPLSRNISKPVRLPVVGANYKIRDASGTEVVHDVMPIPKPLLTIPGRESKATSELVFIAKNIPPLGFVSYYVEETNEIPTSSGGKGDFVVQIEIKDGYVDKIETNGITLDVNQKYFYYKGFVGDNGSSDKRSSGAYVFRPDGTDPVQIEGVPNATLYTGNVVAEIHQYINEWMSQVITIYEDDSSIEFKWLVGPIPISDGIGKEVITKFTTGLSTNGIFYTDTNGREILKRVRKTDEEITEPVASNYYPLTSKILLRDPDQDIELAVLVDRAEGGSSLNDGELEVMIHRRCLHDDAFGAGEALNETAFDQGLVVRGSHHLIFGRFKNPVEGNSIAAQEREIELKKLLGAWSFISPTSDTYEDYSSKHVMSYSGLVQPLPNNVHILTLEPWKDGQLLLRLEHVFGKDEDPELSKPATVQLANLFNAFEIVSVKETTLGGNQWIEDNEKFHFPTNEDEVDDSHQQSPQSVKDDLTVTLNPKQIRTFVVNLKSSKTK